MTSYNKIVIENLFYYKFCVYAMLVLCSNTTTFFAKQFWNMVNFPENTRFYSCFYLTWCHNDVIRQKFWYQKLRNQISNKPMKILWIVVKWFSEYFRKTEKTRQGLNSNSPHTLYDVTINPQMMKSETRRSQLPIWCKTLTKQRFITSQISEKQKNHFFKKCTFWRRSHDVIMTSQSKNFDAKSCAENF